jgi:hypothetical protein
LAVNSFVASHPADENHAPEARAAILPPETPLSKGRGFESYARVNKFRPLLAEFIGTFALSSSALAHGLTIAAFVSATLHISGGRDPALGITTAEPFMTVTESPAYRLIRVREILSDL